MRERQRPTPQQVLEAFWAYLFGAISFEESSTRIEPRPIEIDRQPLDTRIDAQFTQSEVGKIARRSMRRTHPSGRSGRRS